MPHPINAIAYNTKEFTIVDPLTNEEAAHLVLIAKKRNLACTVNKAGRIIVFEANDLVDCTDILSACGLIEDIGLIKEITEYDVQELFEPRIKIELDNDNERQ